jgi:hypothetical protein
MAQADLVVANQSGAAFRADVNNQLQALGTLSSGPNEPSVTYAYMLWADTTTGLLKIRNAANNGWVTIGSLADVGLGLLSRAGGTMTGALLQAAGTAAAPGLAVAGYPGTGLYGRAANELGVAVAGAPTAWFDANGVNLAGQDDVRFWDADSSNYVGLQAPAAVASNLVWTLPAADGTDEQAITTNASGVLGWTSFLKRGAAITAGTSVASTSGTAIDFTGIPSWVKRITVMLREVSLSGASSLLIQLGSGSITSSGYTANTNGFNSTGITNVNSASGLPFYLGAAANTAIGTMTLCLQTGNTWVSSHSGYVANISTCVGGGSVALSGALDRIRITTVNGTDTFDAGAVNILYEG